jgi:hypothetical protein
MGRYIVKIADVTMQASDNIVVTATYAHNEFPSRTLGAVSQAFTATATNASIVSSLGTAITNELQTLDRFLTAKSKVGMQFNMDVNLINEDTIIKRNVPE